MKYSEFYKDLLAHNLLPIRKCFLGERDEKMFEDSSGKSVWRTNLFKQKVIREKWSSGHILPIIFDKERWN